MKKFFQLVTCPLWIPFWLIAAFILWITGKKKYSECLDEVANDVIN